MSIRFTLETFLDAKTTTNLWAQSFRLPPMATQPDNQGNEQMPEVPSPASSQNPEGEHAADLLPLRSNHPGDEPKSDLD